jgi:hypothetical protein
MNEQTPEQKIALLEAKIVSLEKALLALAKAHYGDSQALADFTDKYKDNLTFSTLDVYK